MCIRSCVLRGGGGLRPCLSKEAPYATSGCGLRRGGAWGCVIGGVY